MRSITLLFLVSAGLSAQSLHFGLKGGVPLTDAFDTTLEGNFGHTAPMVRYTVGPSLELRLPFGLGVETGFLYKRQHFSSFGETFEGMRWHTDTYANSWEFPLLLKKRFLFAPVRPFLEGGASFQTLTNVSNGGTNYLENRSRGGVALGAGVELSALFLRVSPQIRYTRWGSDTFADPTGRLRSNRNQADFLLGISF